MVVNVDWFFLSHRLPIALAAINEGYEVHIATSLTQPRAELEKYGLIVHPIDLHRGKIGLLSIMNYFFNLISLLKKCRPIKRNFHKPKTSNTAAYKFSP